MHPQDTRDGTVETRMRGGLGQASEAPGPLSKEVRYMDVGTEQAVSLDGEAA